MTLCCSFKKFISLLLSVLSSTSVPLRQFFSARSNTLSSYCIVSHRLIRDCSDGARKCFKLNKTPVDIRLRPRCCPLPSHFEYIRSVGVTFARPIMDKHDVIHKTGSAVRNVLHCRQRRTEPRTHLTCTENCIKFRHVVF